MLRDAPDPKDIQAFKNAVDHRLSGLREDPYLARRIIANKGREKQVKKRLSLGMVLGLAMILVVSTVLAENWPGISDYLANGLPDRVVHPAETGREEKETYASVIERHAIEPVYAPVRVHLVNDAGEETFAFDLTPQVAQVEYRYTILRRTDGTWVACPDTPVVDAPDQQYQNQAMSPFSPYLFCYGQLNDAEYNFTVYSSDQFQLDFTPIVFSLSYTKEIYLDEQGRIMRTVQDDITLHMGLVDDNGTLSENCFEAIPEDGDSWGPASSPAPAAQPAL